MSEETVPQMRERIEALEKQAKSAEKAAAVSEERARLFEARDQFRDKGFKPEFADLFVKAHEGDITGDAVTEFATKYGLGATEIPAPATGDSVPTPATEKDTPSDTNLSKLSRAGSRPGDGGAAPADQQAMSRGDWNELNKKDPAAARAVLQRGGVQIRKDNFYAQENL